MTKHSTFFRGKDGQRRTDDEIALNKQKAEQRKAAGNAPFRFYVKVGETSNIIITDDAPDFFMYEHALKDAEGRWGRLFTGCVKTFDSCPVCESTGRESYYAMFLSVIDFTPFTTRDGDTVEFSRKLMVVKPAQQKKFLRFYAKEGTLRGASFDMTRDGDKDPSIGNDIDFVEFVSEEELATFTRTWKDKEGKRQTEDCSEPYVYEDLFEEPTLAKLRAVVGGSAPAGSREADRSAVGSSRSTSTRGRPVRDADDWEDAEDKTTQASARGRGRGRAIEEEVVEDEDVRPSRTRGRVRPEPAEEPEEEEDDSPLPPPQRSRRAPAAEPAARPARGAARRAAPVEEEEEMEEEEEEDAPAPARRGRTAAPASRRR